MVGFKINAICLLMIIIAERFYVAEANKQEKNSNQQEKIPDQQEEIPDQQEEIPDQQEEIPDQQEEILSEDHIKEDKKTECTAGEQRLKYEDKSLADQCIKFLENKKFGLGVSEGLTNFKWSFSNLATNSIYEEYRNSSFAQYVNNNLEENKKDNKTNDNNDDELETNFAQMELKKENGENSKLDNEKGKKKEQHLEKEEEGQELKLIGNNAIYIEYEILLSFFEQLFNDHKIDLTQMKQPRPWCNDIRAKQAKTILHENYGIDEELDKIVDKCAENIYLVLDITYEEGEKADMSTIFKLLYDSFSVYLLDYNYVFDEPPKDANHDELRIAKIHFKEFFVPYFYYIKKIVDELKGFQGKFTPVDVFCERPDIYIKSTDYFEVQEMADI